MEQKWKYFFTISRNVLVLNDICKQYGSDQALKIVEPGLRSISFETKHHVLLKTNCFPWGDLNSEDIEILSFLS